MAARRRSAPSPSGPQWAGIVAAIVAAAGLVAAVGTLLGGISGILDHVGSGDTLFPPSTPVPGVTTPPPSTEAPVAGESADPLLVRSIDALPGAMVRIEATGRFAMPPGSRPEDIGRGSGIHCGSKQKSS